MISVFVWAHFQSAWCALVSFLAGVLIDLDHLFDYFSIHRFTFNVRKIYYCCLYMRLKNLYLLLHSYELVALLWIATYVFSLSNTWKAVAIGMTQHIILDQMVNPMKTFGYFIVFRISKGFRSNLIMKKERIRHHGSA